MQTQTINKQIHETLDQMVGKKFTYGGVEHLVKKYTILPERERVQIHTDKKDFDRPFDSLFDFVGLWRPCAGIKEETSRAEQLKTFDQAIGLRKGSAAEKHKASSVIVYQTMDYSRFDFLNGNRSLNERKIKKIINEIQDGNDMLRYYPIQVRENQDRLDILDGQHRFFIDKKLYRPVYYILVEEEKSLPDIAKVNSNVEKWKPEDFINCYVQHGNENYKLISQFVKAYEISLSVTLLLLYTGGPGTEGSHPQLIEAFKDGTFEVKKFNEAVQFCDEVMLFKSFANCRSRAFVIALYRIKKANKITLPELHVAYARRPEMLTNQGNYKSYIYCLEQIVNVGKQNRIVIV